jgi:hypothetical protein
MNWDVSVWRHWASSELASLRQSATSRASRPSPRPDQKRFIYRLLAQHDFLPVWLVADK